MSVPTRDISYRYSCESLHITPHYQYSYQCLYVTAHSCTDVSLRTIPHTGTVVTVCTSHTSIVTSVYTSQRIAVQMSVYAPYHIPVQLWQSAHHITYQYSYQCLYITAHSCTDVSLCTIPHTGTGVSIGTCILIVRQRISKHATLIIQAVFSALQLQRSRVWFPELPDFLRSSGSRTGSTQPHEDNWGATWMEK
jgi:hypothetical protein